MKNISVRFPDELHTRIARAAEEDRRSVNAEILWLIERGLDQLEGGSGASPPP